MNKTSTVPLLLSLAIMIAIPARCCVYAQNQPVSSGGQVIERGTFRIGTFGRDLGKETYEITREGDAIVLQSHYERADRGTKIPLTATLRMKPNFQPEGFEVKGMLGRSASIDTQIEISDRTATVREGTQSRRVAAPERLFTVVDYAPVAVQMMLVRYWAGLESKDPLPILPDGEVQIERRGQDHVEVGGRQVQLDRYSVSGIEWGRQTLWFDADMQLLAAIINGAGTTSLQAVREGYEALLPLFSRLVQEESIATLVEISNRIEPEHQGAFAIVGATLIDGTGSGALSNSAVVVEGDRITAVGPRSRVSIPEGATLVDARGKTLLPGLWDMHAHFQQIEWGPTYLAAGITTVRDVGNEFAFVTSVRDAIHAGRGLGPRMLLAGIIDGEGPNAVGSVHVGTPEDARTAVRRYHDAGFQQIKIYDSVRPDLVPVLTAEAHRLGMTVTGHVPRGMRPFEAIEAGMDHINHLAHVALALLPEDVKRATRSTVAQINVESEEVKQAVQFFKEHGTIVDPTLALYELGTNPSGVPVQTFEPGAVKVARPLLTTLNNTGVPPSEVAGAQAAFERLLDIVGVLHRAGVPIVTGTDMMVPGHSLYREMELYVKAGMTPMEAIQSATIVPARAMKLDHEVGTIEVGKRADLILVEGNPLESIRHVRGVKFVVAGGRMYDSAQLWRSIGFQP